MAGELGHCSPLRSPSRGACALDSGFQEARPTFSHGEKTHHPCPRNIEHYLFVYEWFQLSFRITTTRVVCDLISQKHPIEKTLHMWEGLEKAPGPPSSFPILPSADRVELPAPPHHQWLALGHGGLAFSCTKGQMKDTAKVQTSMGASGGHTS